MRTKFISVLIFFIMSMVPLVYANGTHNEDHEGGTSIGNQFEEILPYHHFAEGHVFAGIMIISFWASFFYTLYSLFRMLSKKK